MIIMEKTGLEGIVEVWTRRRSKQTREWGAWKLDEIKKNLIVNTGYNSLIAGIFTVTGLSSTNFDSFGVSSGTVVPTVTRVATDFDADGTTFRAATTSISFDGATKTLLVTCFLSTAQNTVTSITKFALFDQTAAGGTMWNEVKFDTAKAKSADIEVYIYYRLILTQA